MNINKFEEMIQNKRVVFVSTKNIDYIRNTQEIAFLKKCTQDIKIIGSAHKSYPVRLIKVYLGLIKTLFTGKYEVLFIGFAPQLLFPLFPFISKKKLLVIDFFISFYDTLVDDRKKVVNHSFWSNRIHGVDQYVIKRADIVVTDTQAHRDYFIQEFAVSKDKCLVWYLEADTTIFSSAIVPNYSSDKFTVLYFGSILPVQGLEVILEAMRLLKENNQIQFIIVGPIDKKYAISEEDYPNTIFISWLTQQDLAKEIAKADLCLAGHFSGSIGKADRTIAGKTYIYKAMNKPVILGDSQANHELFVENEENIYVERGNATALAEKIKNKYQAQKQ